MNKLDLKVGQQIWWFDDTHRVYPERSTGFSAPIWREYWRKVYVITENRNNWYLSTYEGALPEHAKKRGLRIIKKEPLPRDYCLTEADVDKRVWIHDHRWQLARAVETVNDYDTLKKVAELIGYES